MKSDTKYLAWEIADPELYSQIAKRTSIEFP